MTRGIKYNDRRQHKDVRRGRGHNNSKSQGHRRYNPKIIETSDAEKWSLLNE